MTMEPKPSNPHETCMPKARSPTELQKLTHLIEEALQDAGSIEPESEHPTENEVEAEVAEACFGLLQHAAKRQTAAESADEVQIPLPLPELVGLLQKTWELAKARGQAQRSLCARLAAAEAESRLHAERAGRAEAARAAAEDEAGQGEKAHELLESTLARLTATRKSVKEKEWELSDARRRVEQLEDDRVRQDVKLRALETALERAASTRCDADRRAAEACTEADREAAKELTELRQQLCDIEVTRDEAKAEHVVAQQSLEEAQRRSELREAELHGQLAEGARRAEDLETRLLQASCPRASDDDPVVNALRLEIDELQAALSANRPGPSEEEVEQLRQEVAQLRAAPPSAAGPSQSKDQEASTSQLDENRSAPKSFTLNLPGVHNLDEEQYIDGVGIITKTPRDSYTRRILPAMLASGGSQQSMQAPRRSLPRAHLIPRVSTAREHSGGGNLSTRSGKPSQSVRGDGTNSMPMDLRALGKLLSGGAVSGKR